MAKEYVPIFFDWTEVTADLEADEKGHLIDAVVMYASGIMTAEEILESLGGMERVAFRFLKGQVDRNASISDARSKAGSNKKEQTETNGNKEEQNETNENKTEQTETKSVKEKEKEKEKDKENNNKDNKRFTPPALEEVEAYCKERGNKVNAQAWFDHYLSNGWMVGKNKMKDWKATVRYWEHSGYDSGQKTAKSVKVSAQNYTHRDYTEEELAGLTNNPLNRILEQLYG